MSVPSQRKFHCAAILFDPDGVLVDSTHSVARFWKRWAGERNVSPEEAVRVAHGRRTLKAVRLLAPHLDAVAETLRIEATEADDSGALERVQGALELLSALPAERWAVVTSHRHKYGYNFCHPKRSEGPTFIGNITSRRAG